MQTETDELSKDELIKSLQADIQQKEQTIIGLNRSYERLEVKKDEQIEELKEIQEKAENILSEKVSVLILDDENTLLARCQEAVEKIKELEKQTEQDKQKLASWKEGKVIVYQNFTTSSKKTLTPEEMNNLKVLKVSYLALQKYEKILRMDQGPWTEEEQVEHQSKLTTCQNLLNTYELALEVNDWWNKRE